MKARMSKPSKKYSPEFRNRLDAIIPFAPLGQDVIRLVVDKFIMQLDAQLADRNVEIELTDAALDLLVSEAMMKNMEPRHSPVWCRNISKSRLRMSCYLVG